MCKLTISTATLVYLLYFDCCFSLLYNAYTDVGTVVGKINQVFYRRNTHRIVSYLGIPYAEESNIWQRFTKSRMREPFKTPYNATYFRSACLQTGSGSTRQETSEDCLFLNIYAPVESTINPRRKFPVIIFIHGGNFKTGSASDISPETLSVVGDLIVVTVNYRLGVFGFLNSGNSFAKGNYGLWDQQLAIRWIRYNIASFGGDVGNITLMGQSAGAASAMFQALYPGNRGLIHRVIAISGTCLSPWALHGSNLRELAEELSCASDAMFLFSDEPLLECIRNRPASDIVAAGMTIDNLGPTIDGDFVSAHPYEILSLQNNSFIDSNDLFRSLDMVLGTNNDDGSQTLVSMLSAEFGVSGMSVYSMLSDELEHVVMPHLLEPVFRKQELFMNYTVNTQTRHNVLHSALYHYTNWTVPDSSQAMIDNLLKLSTDVNFVIPVVQVADGHAYTNTNASTYVYQFVHRPSYRIMAPSWVRGAGHGAELFFTFGFPPKMIRTLGLTKGLVSEKELRLADTMMRWISNFARTG